ncbi:hypothetical protein KBZ20_07170 [Vulcanococcus limneticus Candia 3F8]|uniref:hypothetical protein n=1 Tax=Vulcanococcus limneticus TaxID=2170428 RepID=UPI0012FFC6D1|nr:hypothetical protein [Vulcanococcus limneticus]MCP9791230.1 hypothetical protein [Vulcanococcus limneticus MW73D5]MCP9893552.1 hypothetical protein [Vulcanococcus limneticus Candia 3F8]MCP9896628.1 hypothetical protein [Vulcanococcus limneticus Candia 3B3]
MSNAIEFVGEHNKSPVAHWWTAFGLRFALSSLPQWHLAKENPAAGINAGTHKAITRIKREAKATYHPRKMRETASAGLTIGKLLFRQYHPSHPADNLYAQNNWFRQTACAGHRLATPQAARTEYLTLEKPVKAEVDASMQPMWPAITSSRTGVTQRQTQA